VGDHDGVGTRRRSTVVATSGARAPANRRSGHDSKRLEGLQGVRVEVLWELVGTERTRKIELTSGGDGGHGGSVPREEE
jgi:hypothetical protein